jgi:predicted nucleic acid-binding protein
VDLLVDTNILLRAIQIAHPQYSTAVEALEYLKARGDRLYVLPQILYEFWVVCTRPTGTNGLGLTAAEAFRELKRAQSLFLLLPETPLTYVEWEKLVISHAVLGKQAHDARIAAAMRVSGLTHVLTFNENHLNRYPGIRVVKPAELTR